MSTRYAAGIAALAAGSLLFAGCSPATSPAPSAPTESAAPAPSTDPNTPVTISVGGSPGTDKPEEQAAQKQEIEEFNKLYPHITVEPSQILFEADTFQALLAGGTMPTVLGVPFTEIRGLADRQQVANVKDHLDPSSILSDLNPAVMDVVTVNDGVWGVPYNAYTMGLVYNRGLFTKAGLDPDKPPTTWDEVREAAKKIQDATGVQGFQSMTLDNTGGWILQATSNGFGGSYQSADGSQATITNPGTKAALEFYKALRWEDDTFGANVLLNWEDANRRFASGQVAMMVGGADGYHNTVINFEMDKNDFGAGPMPQAADGIGTLGGGSVYVVSAKASPEEIDAALKWIEFHSFRMYTDQTVAVDAARLAAETGNPVGAPAMPVVSRELYDQSLEWQKEYINVPRENFRAYLDSVETIPVIPEPATKAQETYAIMDNVVQAVLTDANADIDKLLADAQTQVQQLIDSAA